MLFGWFVPNATMSTKDSSDIIAETLNVFDAGFIWDEKLKRSRSKVLASYSRLIDKSSGKNIVKIKSLLGDFQQELILRRNFRLDMPEAVIATLSWEQIECLESELLQFTRKWIEISKQQFEFMNFLVDLERIGDSIRYLFDCEDQQLQMMQLPQAV